MKKEINYTLWILAFITILPSCKEPTERGNEILNISSLITKEQQVTVGTFHGGIPTITRNMDTLEMIYENILTDSLGFSSPDVTEISILDSDPNNSDTAYLHWFGTAYEDGKMITFRVGLGLQKNFETDEYIVNGGGVFRTHTCKGDNCSSCEFTTGFLGSITGCKCSGAIDEAQTSGCEHSVSTNWSAIIGFGGMVIGIWGDVE